MSFGLNSKKILNVVAVAFDFCDQLPNSTNVNKNLFVFAFFQSPILLFHHTDTQGI